MTSRIVRTLGLALMAWTSVSLPAAELKVLIIDGQNNHNWRATTLILQAILEDAGLFAVDVATTPKDLAQFKPEFKKYDAVVSNYNGADWPAETRAAFVDYVRSGGGFVSVHAADNSFPSWKEYNEMIGVGGWGGRNEKDGPMVYWADGKIVEDRSPGGGGSHGSQHAFQIVTRDRTHPITAGLPEKWMHAKDELYSHLRGPAKNMSVLATAFADRKTGGTGRHEPMLITVAYGEGRVFHTTLGHHEVAMQCMGFAVTLQRGTEWVATGKVTQKVPDTFPTADEVRTFTPLAAYRSIRSYEFGDSRADLVAIEDSLRGATPEALAAAEAQLLAALADPETKYAGKQFVLRVLRRVGSSACVPALASLLNDEKLAHNARFALQHLGGKEATAALIEGLERCEGDALIGVVGSLGARGDRAALTALAPLLNHADVGLAKAAIVATSRLGGADAMRLLQAAKVPESLAAARDNGLLACAEALLDAVESKDGAAAKAKARAVFSELSAPTKSSLIRLGAYRGLFRADGVSTLPAIVALLNGDDRLLRQGALAMVRLEGGRDVSAAIAKILPAQAPALQVQLLEALVARGDRDVAYPGVVAALSSTAQAVRVAAIRALGSVGGKADVRRLLTLSLTDGESAVAASKSLASLQGGAVDSEIRSFLQSTDGATRAKALEAAVARRDAGALPQLIDAAKDSDPGVRIAASAAIGVLAGDEQIGAVAALLAEQKDAADRQRLGEALRAIAARSSRKDEASRAIVDALSNADDGGKVALLGVLPALSDAAGLDGARKLLGSSNASVSTAALRALAAWQTPEPLVDLLKIAKSAGAAERKSIALAGYTRLLAQPAARPALKTVELLSEAMALAESVDERRKILSRVADFPCKEAVELAERYAKDPALKEVATESARKVRAVLVRSSLVVSASHNSNDAMRALDGDAGSRWSTNTPMRPGMWYMVDLGSVQSVTRVVLDCRNSPGDYPRGSEVYVSVDGESWGEPILKSPAQRPITRLILPKPTKGRFVKIVQTGRTDGLFWSIHDLRVGFE